ncbi:MAG: response regulator [Spirochaetales bacterium]|nr:response regulator [Spirochaetales bacterium]
MAAVMRKILLVDDQPNFVKMLTVKLSKMGYEILSGGNGKEGLDLAIAEKPDLIMMDIMMPVMDGFAAAKEIRANAETVNIPIIFLSARGQEEDRIRAEQLQAVDFFTKPFSPRAIVERIQELVPAT